jgi:uncharacterized protein HemX
MAPLLLANPSMPEPDDEHHVERKVDDEHHVERKVVYETVSSSTSRMSAATIIIIVVIALALIGYIVMKMR